ncbi:MAG: hypothetical protein ACHP8B_17695 [Terriglobales bacterium]
MRRLSTTGLAHGPVFSWTSVLKKFPGSASVLLLLIVAAAQYGSAQCDGCTDLATANVLGVHNDGGRGCAGCHAPHSGSLGYEKGGAAEAGSIALWGQNASPSYGSTVVFGDTENYVEVLPARGASPSGEVIGILLCLSCHDGNLTPQNMMSSQSYARKMGLLGNPARQPIPTLLADAGSNYSVEHPFGADATIPLGDGLVFTNGAFSVIPGSAYAQFMANYGLPVLAPGKRFVPHGGVNGAGQPYVLCTTCHNQHLMAVYPSTATSPIGDDGGGRRYNTYFFANGPYNPEFDKAPGSRAPSTAQFCRQCHLNVANEGNNALNIRTAFY